MQFLVRLKVMQTQCQESVYCSHSSSTEKLNQRRILDLGRSGGQNFARRAFYSKQKRPRPFAAMALVDRVVDQIALNALGVKKSVVEE